MNVLRDAVSSKVITQPRAFSAGNITLVVTGKRTRRDLTDIVETHGSSAPARTRRLARAAALDLVVPGDADFGTYPDSVRGEVSVLDVDCIDKWITNNILCRQKLRTRLDAQTQGQLPFWDAACCWLPGQACIGDVPARIGLQKYPFSQHFQYVTLFV